MDPSNDTDGSCPSSRGPRDEQAINTNSANSDESGRTREGLQNIPRSSNVALMASGDGDRAGDSNNGLCHPTPTIRAEKAESPDPGENEKLPAGPQPKPNPAGPDPDPSVPTPPAQKPRIRRKKSAYGQRRRKRNKTRDQWELHNRTVQFDPAGGVPEPGEEADQPGEGEDVVQQGDLVQ